MRIKIETTHDPKSCEQCATSLQWAETMARATGSTGSTYTYPGHSASWRRSEYLPWHEKEDEKQEQDA